MNHGTHGMAARVRWVLSPDRSAMLVVEDPAAVENDPLPNGFLLAGESGTRLTQMDSVWDVAPSPDWSRLAVGVASIVWAPRSDSLLDRQWDSLAKSLGMLPADVRAGAFPVSGMSFGVGLARPAVLSPGGQVRIFPVGAGWRVGWSADGSLLIAGSRPAAARDDAPSPRWMAFDPATGTPRGALPAGAAPAPVAWVSGPVIDISVPLDTSRRVVIPVDGDSVVSEHGRIRLGGADVGPGVALAATRTGRQIAALAPRAEPVPEYEPRYALVVYTIDR